MDLPPSVSNLLLPPCRYSVALHVLSFSGVVTWSAFTSVFAAQYQYLYLKPAYRILYISIFSVIDEYIYFCIPSNVGYLEKKMGGADKALPGVIVIRYLTRAHQSYSPYETPKRSMLSRTVMSDP